MDFQDDDALLGATSFNKIHTPGNGAEMMAAPAEQLANSFLRALASLAEPRYVAVYVNGNRAAR